MEIMFKQEDFIDAYKDGEHLLRKHFLELEMAGEFNPNTKGYKALEDKGLLKVYTARIESELVGYCAMIVYKNYQSGQVSAKQEVLYVKPNLRREGLGVKMLNYVESQLKELGIQKLLQCVPSKMDWSALLINDGYKKLETIYSKEL